MLRLTTIICLVFFLTACGQSKQNVHPINEEIVEMLEDLSPKSSTGEIYTQDQAALAFKEKYKGEIFRLHGTIKEIKRDRVAVFLKREAFYDMEKEIEYKGLALKATIVLKQPMNDSEYLSIKLGQERTMKGSITTYPEESADPGTDWEIKLVNGDVI